MRRTPIKFIIGKQGKKGMLKGFLASSLLAWMQEMGINKDVKVRVYKENRNEKIISGLLRNNDSISIYCKENSNTINTLLHECFHLVFRKNKDRVIAWMINNGFKIPRTYKAIENSLGKWRTQYYRKYYNQFDESPGQLRWRVIEEALAYQFETNFTY